MNESELHELLWEAPARFRSVEIGIELTLDYALRRAAYAAHPMNSAVASVSDTDVVGGTGILHVSWRAWLERPDRYWFERTVQGAKQSEASGFTQPSEPVDADRWIDFKVFLGEHVIAEMLDPSDLWTMPLNARDPVSIRLVRETIHRGRPAIATTLEVRDWDVRDPWLEIITIAPQYELTVDRERGVLLRVRSLVEGRVALDVEVTTIEFDGSRPDSVIALTG